MMKKYTRSFFAAIVFYSLMLTGTVSAQERSIHDRIHEEATKNSRVVQTVQILTDVYGPRLTGSPQLKAAGEWAAKQMVEWGLENPRQDPWEFGHPGWTNERAYGHILSPVQDSLVFEVLAWTPSTNGVVKSPAFHFVLPDRPTQEELTAYFNSIRNDIRGKIVLYGEPNVVPVNINPPPKRIPTDMMKDRVDPYRTPTGPGGPQFTPPPPKPGALPFTEVIGQVNSFFMESGVQVRINDAGREHGQIRAFSFSRGEYDVTKTVPTVVMRNEDFGRIVRLTKLGRDVQLEFEISNTTHPEGRTQYNTIAEIPGSDKSDEVIYLGGHLDSWHSATGATDNATGCSVAMEAARILKAIGVKPRRTIRVILWSGEEQGLLGSQAYVRKHYGSAENPTPAWHKFGGYFNHDSGTGRIRGMMVFGPPETASILREIVGPYSYAGVEGVIATRSRNIGGSDHTSFNNAGLPGIGTQLDPIEYGSHTWHTNLDTFERIIPEDLQQGAMVIAAAVYQLAMRDELLPRFPAGQMPEAPRRNE